MRWPQGHRATGEADELLKFCPKLQDDKKAGPKQARVHSRRDGSLGHGHTQVSFPPVLVISQQDPGEVG